MSVDLDSILEGLVAQEGRWFRSFEYGEVDDGRRRVAFACTSEQPEFTASMIDDFAPGLVDLEVAPLRCLQTPKRVRVTHGPGAAELTVSWRGGDQAVIDVRESGTEIAVSVREYAEPTWADALLAWPRQRVVVSLDGPALGRPVIRDDPSSGTGWSRRYDSTVSYLSVPGTDVRVIDPRPSIIVLKGGRALVRLALDGQLDEPAAQALAQHGPGELSEAHQGAGFGAAVAVIGGRFPEIEVTLSGPMEAAARAVQSGDLADALFRAVKRSTPGP